MWTKDGESVPDRNIAERLVNEPVPEGIVIDHIEHMDSQIAVLQRVMALALKRLPEGALADIAEELGWTRKDG